jgi:hypothetical protein
MNRHDTDIDLNNRASTPSRLPSQLRAIPTPGDLLASRPQHGQTGMTSALSRPRLMSRRGATQRRWRRCGSWRVLHASMAGSPSITHTLRGWRLTVRDVSTDSHAGALSTGQRGSFSSTGQAISSDGPTTIPSGRVDS